MIEDKSLINQCLKGERKAQKALYEKYRSYWFVICLRYSNDRNEACDILQNALINIYSKLNQFKADLGSFKSWSSKVVVNDCIMYIRKKKKYQFESDLSDQLNNVRDSYDVISSLSSEEIVNLVMKLPIGYRTVFNLYAIEGYSHKEIGAKLGIAEVSSRSNLSRAKQLLRKKLQALQNSDQWIKAI